MSEERRLRAEELFQQAADLSGAARKAFLDSQCAGDDALRAQVETLLEHAERANTGFLREPPVRLGAPGVRVTDPESIGPYRILSRLGEGGFGVVYVAQQTQPIRRRVALKVVKAGMDTDAVLARFEAERQALALMDHPNIARVLDAGASAEGRPYFVMELVKGEALNAYCDGHRLQIRERLTLFVSICQAVQHAHQKGIIHRDLKPTNVLVTLVDGQPVPKIIDFGIAKAMAAPLTDRTLQTVQGTMMGTPAYMSPEQALLTGLDVDTTTDVYSLGVILYELLSGFLPHDPAEYPGIDPLRFGEMLRDVEPARPSARLADVTERAVRIAQARKLDAWKLAQALRGELDWIVMRAIEKERTRRYQTALDLAHDIERHLHDEPVTASPPRATYRLRKFVRRHRVGLAVAGAVVFALMAAGTALTYALIQSNQQRTRLRQAQQESEAVSNFLSSMLSEVTPGAQGRDVTVKGVLDQAGPTLTQQFGEQPLIEAKLRTTMGVAYRELGEFAVAEDHLLRALELRRQHEGSEHPATWNVREQVGILRRQQGAYDEAESTFRAVLEAHERIFGPESREALRTISELGQLDLRRERADRIIERLEPALDIAHRELGEDDPLTRVIAGILALGYKDVGRFEDAERMFRENIVIDERVFGPNHAETLSSYGNLGSLYRETGRLDEALPFYVKVVHGARELFGEEHPEYLRYQSNLALVYSDMGRFGDAEPISAHVLETRRQVLGANHPSTIVSGINHALLFYRTQRWDECVRVARDVHESAARAMGDDHFYALAAQGVLGSAYLGRGDHARAEGLLREAADKLRVAFHERHWRVGRMLVRHGAALSGLERYEEAEQRMLEGVAILEEAFGADDDRVLEAVQRLIDLYDRWDKPDEKATWLARRSEAR